MKLTYWSHSCFLIETGNHRLVIDPFLSGNPLAQIKPDDVKCDFILVTHGHQDHLGDAVAIAKKNDAIIISTFEVAMHCIAQGAKAHPMGLGGGWNFPFGRVKITIAHHSGGYPTDNGFLYLGNPAGMIISAEGKNIYHAGDTALFLDMKLIGELTPIDVALLPIGDNFTMGIDDAVRAVQFLNAKTAVPIHYNTFDLIKADPEEFAKKVNAIGAQGKALKTGESLDV